MTTLKAGQQVHLLFDQDATGTVSLVRDGKVAVTWNHAERGKPRMRRSYPAPVAQVILVPQP